MKTLKVPDMHCEKCVSRIKKALGDRDIEADVMLDSKTVAVEDSRVAEAIDSLDDLGFTVEE